MAAISCRALTLLLMMLCTAWPVLGMADQLVAGIEQKVSTQKVTAQTDGSNAKPGIAQRRAARQFIAAAIDNSPPVNFLNAAGQLSGFGIELSTAVVEAAGGHVSHLHSGVWGEVMADLESGRADFIHDTGYTPERAIAFDFTDPILEMPESIFVAVDRYDISGLDTLKGRQVACVKGEISHLYLQKFPQIDCLLVATPSEGLQALVTGRVEAFVYPRQVALFLAQKNGWSGKIKATGEPLRHLTWHMAVRMGDVEMLALLNNGIAIVKTSGAYDRIYEKWFGRVLFEGYSERELEIAALAAAILSAVLAGVVFLALYVRRLRRSRGELRRHISERNAAQETLSHFFDLSQNMLCVAGFDGYFKRINKAWSDVLGFSEAELLRTPFIDFVHPDDREATLRESMKLGKGEVTVSFESRYRTSNGEYRWLLWHAVGLREAEQIYATATDITLRKNDEEALRQSRDLLEQRVAERTTELSRASDEAQRANAAKSEFLSRMSHELRTPLNAILGFGQLMELEATTAVQTDYVGEILHAGQHLLVLINDVLDLARVESGRLSVSLEPVPLSEMIDECLTLLQPQASARGIRLSKAASDCDVQVLADRTRLKQVLLNLLSNAVKYNKREGAVNVLCVMHVEGGKQSVCLRINDTGAGLTPEQQAKLFVPFERLDVDPSIEGTGIGLALTKRLVELMNGEVGIESTPGLGSTFWVRLALSDSPEASHRPFKRSAEIAALPADKTRRLDVLCIEDNPANLRLIESIFARRPGVRLLTAIAPGLGLELARSHQPALILLDINLPDMDGYEVMQILRENAATRSIPVVAISANAMPKDIERGRAAGFVDYVTKPFDLPHLLQVIDKHLSA